MKKRIWVLIVAFSLFSINLYAASGDLVVQGNLTVQGTTTATNVMARYYESPPQTITSAGSLPLTHGLGKTPVLVQVWLVCQTAEANYSVGDWLRAENNDAPGNNSIAIRATSTNLYVRFSSNANVFTMLDPTTGHALALTNGRWKAVFRAWAF